MNGACAKCTGNTIKTNVGNSSDCNTDPACDGTIKVPNDLHNDCGIVCSSICQTVDFKLDKK